MATFVGIDPGVGGGIGVIDEDKVWAFDMPTITTEVKRRGKKPSKKNTMDVSSLRHQLNIICPTFVVIEKVPPLVSGPGGSRMGSAVSFQMGRSFGICEGVVAGLGFPYILVTPQTWKRAMLEGTSKDKAAAVLKATQMFPSVPLPNKADHNKAEGLLLAQYAKLNWGQA